MKKIDLMLCLAVVGMMASGCTLEGACKDQDLKCLTDPDTQEGVRYTCIDGAWMNKELGNSCKDEKTWGICLNGARKCEDGGMKTCVNGAWSAPDNSCGSRGCKSTSECADCSDDEVLCNKETNRYKPCMNGAWLSMDFSCPSDLCNEDGTGCADKPECAGSDVECYDGVLNTCHEGKWHEEKCPNDTACKLDNTGCAECSGNETSCKDGSYRVCFNEVWQDVKSCTCKDDKVCAECTAGQSECDSLSSYRECSSSNVWGESQSCGNRNCAVNDTKAECTDAPVTCDDNKKQCIGNTLYVCNSNDWKEVKTCEFGCNSEKLDCYECEEGKMSCTNGRLKKCINHVWSEPIVCKGGACLDENTCANCVLGISCSDNSDSVGTVTKCEDGITQTQLKCENVSCNAERNDCGKCVNSAQKCVTGDDMIGTPYICVNGGWSYGNRCSGEASCKNDTQCGDCRNGTTKCEDRKVFTCKDASWGTGVPCANGCNSSGSGCLPSDVCVNGSERCENGVKYTCLNNAWGSEKTCTGGVSCADDTRCGECVNSRSTCENGVLYICQNGIWGVGIQGCRVLFFLEPNQPYKIVNVPSCLHAA